MSATERVTVLGAGTMGGGIAALVLESGLHVTLYDPLPEALERARVRAAKRVPADAIEARLRLTNDLRDAVAHADVVIEAVPERLELKLGVFSQVDDAAPAAAIVASNTSELSLTALAAATSRPDRVVGMHWFNPPERMKLVEVVRALQTSEATLDTVRALAERCGKTTVTVADRQGS